MAQPADGAALDSWFRVVRSLADCECEMNERTLNDDSILTITKSDVALKVGDIVEFLDDPYESRWKRFVRKIFSLKPKPKVLKKLVITGMSK